MQGLYIKRLDLSDNQISAIGPQAFSGLENILQSLSLKGNLLPSLPATAIDGMSALLQLDLSQNLIGDIKMKEVRQPGHREIKNTWPLQFSTRPQFELNDLRNI